MDKEESMQPSQKANVPGLLFLLFGGLVLFFLFIFHEGM